MQLLFQWCLCLLSVSVFVIRDACSFLGNGNHVYLVRFQLYWSFSQLVLQMQTNFMLKLVMLVLDNYGLCLTLLVERWIAKFGVESYFESRFFCSCESACITCTFTTLWSDHLMIQYFGEALASSGTHPCPPCLGVVNLCPGHCWRSMWKACVDVSTEMLCLGSGFLTMHAIQFRMQYMRFDRSSWLMSWVEALLDRGIAAAHQLDKCCDPPSLVTKRPHVDFSFSRQSAFTFSVAAIYFGCGFWQFQLHFGFCTGNRFCEVHFSVFVWFSGERLASALTDLETLTLSKLCVM